MEGAAAAGVNVRSPGVSSAYRVEVGAGLSSHTGELMRRVFKTPARHVALVSNRRVFNLYGERVRESLNTAGYKTNEILIGDGERFKTLRTAETVLRQLTALGFERDDVVLALGGGVIGDLAGFAAGVYLRGIAFVNVPTTLLAQIDASVGGKTAVNTPHSKNSIGLFLHPRLVIADTTTLLTLDRRDLTAGWCEAIKHGAVGDRQLFDDTRLYLTRRHIDPPSRRRETIRADAASQETSELAVLISRHVAFKARIVADDEREDVGRTDACSRRILNFGHTVGHAIEAATGFRRFRHGEAVGRGMVAAALISKELGFLDESSLALLTETIGAAGQLPVASDLDAEKILEHLSSDKKSINGSIQWVLLDRIGRARLTDSRSIPPAVIHRSVRLALDYEFRPPTNL